MLTRLSVKNFRLLRDVTIDVEPGKPIVLIGPNGSGKSSVIQVLDLLASAASEGWDQSIKKFGGAAAVVTVGPDDQRVKTEIEITLDQTDQDVRRSQVEGPLRYTLGLLDGRPRVEALAAPSSSVGASPLLRRDGRDLELLNQHTHEYEAQLPTVALQGDLSFHLVKNKTTHPALEMLRESLAVIGIYDGFLTTPLWTRDVREGRLSPFDAAVVESCDRIDRRGLDLINALYYLQENDPDEWDELERSFKAEFPFVQRLEFPADPAGGRLGFGWRDLRYPGVRMRGHQMSEGMTTYLCLLAAVLSTDLLPAIAFDEPERNLHPSALRRAVYLLEKLSERTAVFVATHSDRFLDYLSDPAGSLRVCEPSGEGVSIQKLDREVLDVWRAKFTLSELRRRGQIDPENASNGEP